MLRVMCEMSATHMCITRVSEMYNENMVYVRFYIISFYFRIL